MRSVVESITIYSIKNSNIYILHKRNKDRAPIQMLKQWQYGCNKVLCTNNFFRFQENYIKIDINSDYGDCYKKCIINKTEGNIEYYEYCIEPWAK